MSARKLKNIPVKLFREFLVYKGLKHIRTNGGHEIWSKKSLARPVIFQTHKNPIPEFIIKNNLRTMGCDTNDFYEFVEKH